MAAMQLATTVYFKSIEILGSQAVIILVEIGTLHFDLAKTPEAFM